MYWNHFKINYLSVFIIVIFCSITSCTNTKNMAIVTVEKNQFGKTIDGADVDKYILSNKNGMEICIITYGGIITSWTAADKNGDYRDIVLGYNTLAEYEAETPYFGALIGRYGNRIAKGKFSIDGEAYTLAVNNGENHLHGGLKGFDKVVWDAKTIVNDSTASLELSYLSKDMEEGYPGNLQTNVTYTLNNKDELSVKYEAKTDKPTIVNLTQHSYFNLSGDFSKQILDHELLLNADQYLPIDNTQIPEGNYQSVVGTPFDFSTPKTIGRDIETKNEQLKIGNGYDHCWVINNPNNEIFKAAEVYHPDSGRTMNVYTDQPGMQLYTGNFLDNTLPSKTGGTYGARSGFCLETQHFPNAPNEPSFPTTILKPGETFTSETRFQFSVK
jgi:aldose 1-epimerase